MTTTTTNVELTVIEKLAKRTIEFMQVNQIKKGKRRDELTITFWQGAWAALADAGMHGDAEWVQRVTFLLIHTRGYSECERIVANIGKKKED